MTPHIVGSENDPFGARELPAPTRRWCFPWHQWWSRNTLIGRWTPTPDWYVGNSPPDSKTCIKCGKTVPTNFKPYKGYDGF